MKKAIVALFTVALFLSLAFPANAYVNVKGYTKKNGTYVAPHVRSEPNGLKSDNYGYKPSQGLYNSSYGTRGSSWDTPSYITDPDYYQGKSIYDSLNSGGSSGIGSGYSGYSYPTTPTCPANSYYDGVSSCKCNYGYSVSGSSCVSNDSLCWDQVGYNSSYDSLSGSCKCSYGYVIGSSGRCESASLYCSSKYGLMSQYNSISKTCECMAGYEFNGTSCVYKQKTYTYPYGGSGYSGYNYGAGSTGSAASCPLNSHESPLDSTKCVCDTNYKVNATKDACVLNLPTPKPYQDNEQLCQNSFSTNSKWDGTLSGAGSPNCICKPGFAFNSSRTMCLPATR